MAQERAAVEPLLRISDAVRLVEFDSRGRFLSPRDAVERLGGAGHAYVFSSTGGIATSGRSIPFRTAACDPAQLQAPEPLPLSGAALSYVDRNTKGCTTITGEIIPVFETSGTLTFFYFPGPPQDGAAVPPGIRMPQETWQPVRHGGSRMVTQGLTDAVAEPPAAGPDGKRAFLMVDLTAISPEQSGPPR